MCTLILSIGRSATSNWDILQIGSTHCGGSGVFCEDCLGENALYKRDVAAELRASLAYKKLQKQPSSSYNKKSISKTKAKSNQKSKTKQNMPNNIIVILKVEGYC